MTNPKLMESLLRSHLQQVEAASSMGGSGRSGRPRRHGLWRVGRRGLRATARSRATRMQPGTTVSVM